MRLTIPRIVVLLLAVMTVVFVVWEMAEDMIYESPPAISPTVFYMVRGISTAVLMIALTAWLMILYRRKYEEELRLQSEEAHRLKAYYENIVQDAGEAIVSLDNEGIIRSWNRAAEVIFGYTAEEIIGHPHQELIPPDLIEAREPESLAASVRRDGFVQNIATRRLRKDGTTVSVRITRSILRDSDGQAIGSLSIVTDITAQLEMEARLIHAEKLAAIGQAAASTAHEVRNALAGIGGTIQILEGTPAWTQLPAEVGDEVKAQIARIANIIDDLLSYARPGKLARRRVDLHQMLDRAISRSASEAHGRKTMRAYAEGPILLEADSDQLEQAFRNLIINAYQAMNKGGRLEVSTLRQEDKVLVRFRDTGHGMARQTLEHALEPFFTTKARGSGLGLAIVQAIVEAHQGEVSLQSAPDDGTTVTVALPSAEGVQSQHAPPQSAAG